MRECIYKFEAEFVKGEIFYGRAIKAAKHGKSGGRAVDSADELKQIGSKTAWLKIRAIDKSACINRLMALKGAIRGVKKTMLSDEVKADLKSFYKYHKFDIYM